MRPIASASNRGRPLRPGVIAGLGVTCAVALALALGAAPAPARGGIPFARFLEVRGQRGASISPDGNAVVYLDAATGTRQAWQAGVDCGWPMQLTFFDERVRSADWSPYDPDRILVSSDRGGNERYQLYLLRPDGTGLERLTDDDDAIHSFGGWSPDGRSIAYRSNARQPSEFDAYVLDLETHAARRVYESDGILSAAGFSPAGGRLLLLRTVAPDENRLLVCDLAGGTTRLLTPLDEPARYYYTFWTPDGRSLLLLTDRGREFLSLARLDVATGELTFLRDDPWPAERLEVAANGTRLALVLNHDGYSELRLADPRSGRELPAPPVPPGVIGGLDFTPDGRRLAIVEATPRAPDRILVYDLESAVLRQVTRAAMAGIDTAALSAPRIVHYPSFDGRLIPGLLYEPAARNATRRAPGSGAIAAAAGDPPAPPPCLVYAHGGPTSQSRPRFSALVQYFTSRGYVVFAPNVRGSTGYGRTYMNLDNGPRREDAVADLEAGVDWLIAAGAVDSARVAVYGGSYGGYMALAALTLYPERWAAGVASVGISNFVSFLERTGSYRRAHREREYGNLEHDRALLERLSPLGRADRIRAPLMVIHGANDPRVPIQEAEQIVAALRARGRPVEFLRFEHEGHGLSRLDDRITAYTRMGEFLDRYLGIGDAPPPRDR